MKTIRIYLVFFVGMFFLLTMGCARQQHKYSGFLENYPEFGPGREGGVDLLYLKEGVDFKKYYSVMLDHVVFYFEEDSQYKGIHADEMKELADAFHYAVADALNPYFGLVEKPGPNVMRIRMAVTGLKPSKPGLSAVTTITPVGLAISMIKSGAGGGHTGVGSASMEAEILDSETNERIAAAIDTKPGGKTEGLSKWGAVEGAFKFWGKRLRMWLDEIHNIK